MTIANLLTFIRLFISPLFMLIYLEPQWFGLTTFWLPYVLLLLLAASELSDAFDGWIARRTNTVTDFGKLFDPMADSITHIAIYLSFTAPPVNIPLLFVFVFIYRDAVITTLRAVCAIRGVALAARRSGKAKSILQGVGAFIILGLMALQSSYLQPVAYWVTAVAAAVAIVSAVEYFVVNRHEVKKLFRKN